MKKIIAGIVLLAVALGMYFYVHAPAAPTTSEVASSTNEQIATTTEPAVTQRPATTTIGTSVQGRDIVAYHFGTGDKEILLVGGIHGGYEWNTALVAFELVQYLQQHPEAIPQSETVTVVPVLNPDGLNAVVGTAGEFSPSAVPSALAATIPGRFNANHVDLNRNFDCDWKATGTWQNTPVSGGTKAFSEPESGAIRDYVMSHTPVGVVVWYSAAGGVYASSCHEPVLDETKQMTDVYAKASGYPSHESFDFYATTGDMVNWLAKNKIPAISVLLTNHTDIEWDKNKSGIEAVLKHFAQ